MLTWTCLELISHMWIMLFFLSSLYFFEGSRSLEFAMQLLQLVVNRLSDDLLNDENLRGMLAMVCWHALIEFSFFNFNRF